VAANAAKRSLASTLSSVPILTACSRTARCRWLWSNVQTLQPAVYQRMPHPVVSRRFSDEDSVARVASELLERCISFNMDAVDFDETIRLVRDDYLLAARGTVWIRYEAEISEDPMAPAANERVPVDYVSWEDFGHNAARTWAEVTAVWRKTYLTREQGVQRFGEKFRYRAPRPPQRRRQHDRAGCGWPRRQSYRVRNLEQGSVRSRLASQGLR